MLAAAHQTASSRGSQACRVGHGAAISFLPRLDAYLWLSLKFPDCFTQRDECAALQATSAELITEALLTLPPPPSRATRRRVRAATPPAPEPPKPPKLPKGHAAGRARPKSKDRRRLDRMPDE